MTARERRLVAALLTASIVTGLECDVTSAPLANLASGLLLGIPAGIAAWTAMTVAQSALARRRMVRVP